MITAAINPASAAGQVPGGTRKGSRWLEEMGIYNCCPGRASFGKHLSHPVSQLMGTGGFNNINSLRLTMSWECKSNGGIISFTSPPLFTLSTAGDGSTEVFVSPPPWFPFSQGRFLLVLGWCGCSSLCRGHKTPTVRRLISSPSWALVVNSIISFSKRRFCRSQEREGLLISWHFPQHQNVARSVLEKAEI